ncbi:MAG TPA: ATP-binding protein [Burkholderiales bacterium]|nr:ATP-binding protein [Burkholderiales bacterium]
MNSIPNDASSTELLPFLTGGGEMGAATRKLEWSNTLLGPVQSWPQSLRTSISTCLNCSFPILIWWGPDLVMLYNDAYRPILGTKHPNALGQRGCECWPEIWHVIGPMLERVLANGTATAAADLLLLLERNGYPEECYFSFSYSPIHDESGRVGGVFCPVIETTAKVIGERRLRTLRDLAALSRSDSLTATAAAICHVLAANPYDIPFALLYLRDAASQGLQLAGAAGIEPGGPASPPFLNDEADGRVWRVDDLTAEARCIDDLPARFAQLPTGAWQQAPRAAISLPVILPGEAGAAAVLVCALNPHRSLDAEYRQFLDLIVSQIATAFAEVQAYEAERRRVEALAQIDRAKTTFFSNVSHEFRTPLTLMLGPMEDALASAEKALRGDDLEAVHRNGLRLLRLVNTLLDFSRIEAGRIEASYEPVDLAAFTQDLVSVFRSAIEKAGLRLSVDCEPLPEPVYVDREMWEKIVLNLLSNAFKFTFDGEIAVALRWRGADVELVVRDSGIGIPADQLPHVFDRFHRVPNARGRTHEGTGIGLALVKELVRYHAGTIAVDSEIDRGSAFTVRIPTGSSHLPKERIEAGKTISSTALGAAPYLEEALRWLPEGALSEGADAILDAQPADSVSPAMAARILVVDDNADMRRYLHQLLARQWTVEAVGNGGEALRAVRREPPDLILSDIMMPELDGYQLLQKLRADPATREIPVILLSARAGEEARVEGMEAGADDYLVKPFAARELTARIRTHLELARVRREANRAVRESEARLRALVTASSDVVYRMSPDWREMRQLQGREFLLHTDAPSTDWLDKYIAPDDRQHVLCAIEDAIRTKRVFELEHRVLRADGTPGWTLSRAVPLFDSNGNVVEWFGTATDITERKRAEQVLAADLEYTQLLRELGARLLTEGDVQTLYQEILDVAIVLTHADAGTVQILDPDGHELVMLAAKGFESAMAAHFHRVGVHCNTSCGEALARNERTFVDFDVPAEQDPDGSLRMHVEAGYLSAQSTPLIARSGKPIGMVSTHWRKAHHRPGELELRYLDLLARQAADLIEQRQAQEALREADRRKDEFLATLAHELRNPLAPIRAGLHALQLGGLERDEAQRVFETMNRQMKHLVRLVDDLLEVSRITRGKIELHKERIDLMEVVEHAVEISRPLIDAGRHRLIFQLPVEAMPVHADPVRLAQVFANLLNNAAKYTPADGRIEIAAKREDADAVVSVRDSGIGILPQMLPHVFDLFTQGERTGNGGQSGGLGIGLALVRRLVEMHGGRVEARSEGANRGSEFSVRLPLAAPFDKASAPPLTSEPVPVFHTRILVTDDNRDAADSQALLLEALGAEVRVAYDGESALQAMSEFKPELVLLDLGMPQMDGFETARRIRQHVNGSDVKLVALTGWGQDEDRERTRQAGFDDHLVKPVSIDQMRPLLSASKGARQRARSDADARPSRSTS